jgi:hypothetical protein
MIQIVRSGGAPMNTLEIWEPSEAEASEPQTTPAPPRITKVIPISFLIVAPIDSFDASPLAFSAGSTRSLAPRSVTP